MEADLISIAQAMNPGNGAQRAQRALAWLRLQSQSKWLIIFDSADDPSLLLRNYLPQGAHANILITSRNANLREELTPGVSRKISGMTPIDARELLLRGLNTKTAVDREKAADAIVKVRYQ
jgi:hypothetical protein